MARGRGIGLCVATGMDTELGRIAGLLAAAGLDLTPLQKRLAAFGRRLSLLVTAEVLTLLLAPFLGMPLPLLPIHILWINLVTDGLPGLALTVEPAERDVMRRPPRPLVESLSGRGLWQHMAVVGGLMAALALLSLAWALGEGSEGWQTLVVTVLVLAQLMHVVAIRSERDSPLTR